VIITAKYKSKCSVCGGVVLPGDAIRWAKGKKAVEHQECSKGPVLSPSNAQPLAPFPNKPSKAAKTANGFTGGAGANKLDPRQANTDALARYCAAITLNPMIDRDEATLGEWHALIVCMSVPEIAALYDVTRIEKRLRAIQPDVERIRRATRAHALPSDPAPTSVSSASPQRDFWQDGTPAQLVDPDDDCPI
jgi:hypothetical protein